MPALLPANLDASEPTDAAAAAHSVSRGSGHTEKKEQS